MQLVVHSPYGSRLNRAWGLALRKRFCGKFNFEIQAAATEDNIVISLTEAHSFALADVARYLHSAIGARRADPGDARFADVHHALALGARASRSPCRASAAARRCRRSSRACGAEDLIGCGVPRPDRLRREPAGRPRDSRPSAGAARRCTIACTRRWTSRASSGCCEAIESGAVQVIARDLTQPSPLALEVLTARPYAFLDDAPLEERRTQAVMARRWLAPEQASEPGPARRRGDRARARARRGPMPRAPTSCMTRWSGWAS